MPIRAFQFTLVPSANLTLADKTMAEDGTFYYACRSGLSTNGNSNGMYSQIAYTPGSRYFGAAGTDEGKGITEKTEVMTIMGKVNGVGEYTLSMTGVVAGNGDAPDSVTQKFTSTVAGATVTVKTESERPQPNLSLALSTGKVNVGDTFTATLSNEKMSIISFVSQIRFNKDVLEVVSITEGEGYTNLVSGAVVKVKPTVDEANANGVVGISIAKTVETTYPAKNIVTVTFKAKAVGDGWFELVESTDGTDGYHGDNSGGTVTVEAGTQDSLVMRVVPQAGTVCPKAANATVKFDVVIEKNPGVAAAQFTVGYDKSKLVLVGVTKADGMLGTLTVEGDKFLWDYSEDLTETGNFLQLTFTAKTGATMGSTSATLIHVDEGDVSNYDEEDVATQIYSGEVMFAHTYEEYVPTSEDVPVTPATCTTKATYCKRCTCGEESTETFEYGELTGHDFRTVSVVPATDAAAGVVTSICSRCDETETEKFAFADAAVRLTVGTADGTAKIHRGTIDVPVAIAVDKDKGMDSAEFAVAYDKTRLVLTGVSTGWILDGDTVKTATKLTGSTKVVLTFAVKTDADNFVNPGDAVVSISDAKVYSGEEIMTIGAISGKVVVTKAGDINGDGKINSKDVTRLRKIVLGAEKDVLGAANINGDAKVNSKDVTRLRKCVLGVTSEVYY